MGWGRLQCLELRNVNDLYGSLLLRVAQDMAEVAGPV